MVSRVLLLIAILVARTGSAAPSGDPLQRGAADPAPPPLAGDTPEESTSEDAEESASADADDALADGDPSTEQAFAADDPMAMEAQAIEELLEIMDVTVVTAAKTKQTLEEASSVISVVTREEIRRRSHHSIADALGSIPGLYINTDYVFRDVGVRGISGEMRGASRLVKVMINGLPVSFRSDTANFLGPEMIPMDAVERIEVIRGPGSALYGANAFLGVINVVTRKAADIQGSSLQMGLVSFGENLGYSAGMVAGGKLGPVELLAAVQRNRIDRSGLSIPCTTFAGDCVEQREKANEPAVFERVSFDDIEEPVSALVTGNVDIGHAVGSAAGSLGTAGLVFNHQEIDSRASFSDWAVMERDTYVDVNGNPRGNIEGSGNRVGLFNSTLRGTYSSTWLNDRLQVDLAGVFAKGGVADHERLRDAWSAPGAKERRRYGFEGRDISLETHITLIEDVPGLDTGPLAGLTVIDSVKVLLAADYSRDAVRYAENKFEVPVRYRRSRLENQGVLGQLTARLFNNHTGLTAGARFDRYRGARLSATQLGKLETGALPGSDTTKLCDGRICYDSLNYRIGLTHSIIKNPVDFSNDAATLFNNLYVKAFAGTAFKAPAPLFLLHDDSALPIVSSETS